MPIRIENEVKGDCVKPPKKAVMEHRIVNWDEVAPSPAAMSEANREKGKDERLVQK